MNMKKTQPANTTICKKHGTPVVALNNSMFPGFTYCPTCSDENEKKEVLRIEKEKLETEEKRRNWCIPKIFQSARLDNFSDIDPVLEWVNDPRGFLFVHGVCGCGKSHLASAIQYKHNCEKKECRLAFSSDLFLKIRSSFGSNAEHTERELIEGYSSGLRIFDDIGAQKISDYVIEAWYNIIDKRYMDEVPTMFTSNLSLKEISLCMTDRIASRIASGKIFELKGKDRRLMRS